MAFLVKNVIDSTLNFNTVVCILATYNFNIWTWTFNIVPIIEIIIYKKSPLLLMMMLLLLMTDARIMVN